MASFCFVVISTFLIACSKTFTKLAEEKSNILNDLSKEKADADIMYLRTRAKRAQFEVKQLESKLLPAEWAEIITDITNATLTNLSNYKYTPTPEFIKKYF